MRPVFRASLVAVSAVSLSLLPGHPGGIAQATAPSSSCDAGTALVEVDQRGYAGLNSLRVGIAAVGSSTLLCYSVDAYRGYNTGAHAGGVISIEGVTVSGAPRIDTDAGYCRNSTSGTPTVPVEGSVGDPADPASASYYAQGLIDDAGVHLCIAVGGAPLHLVAGVPAIGGMPNVAHTTDPSGTAYQSGDMPEVPMGSASDDCEATAYREQVTVVKIADVSVRYVDGIYTDSYGDCVRINTPAGGWGFSVARYRLVETDGLPTAENYMAPECTVAVAQGVSPIAYEVRRSPTGALPAYLCVRTPANPSGLTVKYGVPTAGLGSLPQVVFDS